MIKSDEKSSGLPFRDAFGSAFLALILSFALVGMRTASNEAGMMFIESRVWDVVAIVGAVFVVRLLLPSARTGASLLIGVAGVVFMFVVIGIGKHLEEIQFATLLVAGLVLAIAGIGSQVARNERVKQMFKSRTVEDTLQMLDRRDKTTRGVIMVGLVAALAFPFLPITDRYLLDLAILILTYLVLGWGLNIVVGLAGLLDLGFVAFYAVGAYAYSLLAIHFGVSFWVALPLAAAMAALFGFLLGFPVLRLRGDYFAIVTLGFGEIIRIILLNWTEMSGGPDGLTGIPRPSFFGMAEFTRNPGEGVTAFHEMFGIEYSSTHRIIFLYFIVLMLAIFASHIAARLKKMPIGRAWEALREDDIACQAMGVSRTTIKLWAFMISASFGGIAGAFFATRQGYVSPESFTFIESAIVLAIVVLGGMGSQLGVLLATLVIIGLPEVFREIEGYRMLAFGAAMVLIMVWRPNGILSSRDPSVWFARMKQSLPGRVATEDKP